jgi:hypothetical protein
MYPVSSAFLTRIRGSHIAPVTVEVWDTNSNSLITNIYPISGQVSVDNRRDIRRQCELTVVDIDGTLVPANGFATLSPFNRELRVHRGVRYDDGTEELVPLGVFIITKVKIDDGQDGVKITLEGSDRSLRIAKRKWYTNDFWIDEGTAKEDAIKQILLDRVPETQVDFIATNQTTTVLYPTLDQASDPWKQALDIAKSAGVDLYFDVNGVARLRNIPDPDTGVVDIGYLDNEEAVVTTLSRELGTDDSFNGVIFTGEGTNLTIGVLGVAWDDNPNSPTYRNTYGEVPMFKSSATVLTVEEAETAAVAELRKVIGAAEKIEWSQLVNPAQDVYDLVKLVRAPSKVDATLVLDSVTIPLGADQTMSAVARSRRF